MLFDCYDGVIWFTRYTFFSDPLTLPLELGLLDDGRAYSFFDYLVATDWFYLADKFLLSTDLTRSTFLLVPLVIFVLFLSWIVLVD